MTTAVAMRPTTEQQAFVDAFEEQFGPMDDRKKRAIILEARAGSGKTSSLMLIVRQLVEWQKRTPRTIKACVVSFNKDIKVELENKISKIPGAPAKAMTTNGLGASILAGVAGEGFPMPILDQDEKRVDAGKDGKYQNRIKRYFKNMGYTDRTMPYKLISSINTLVNFCQQTMTDPSQDNLIDLVMHYDLDNVDITNARTWSIVWPAVRPVINAGIAEYKGLLPANEGEAGLISFGDQIAYPLELDLAAPVYDLIMVDECQDLNAMRLELVRRALKPNGLLIFVGDEAQAIQGFAGADTDSMGKIKAAVNPICLPLNTCFRCDRDILFMARQIVPEITPRADAGKGIVKRIDEEMMFKDLREGYTDDEGVYHAPDMVLCRTRAPMVSMCLRALRSGKKAMIKGKEISKEFTGLLTKMAKEAGYKKLTDFPWQELTRAEAAYVEKWTEKFGDMKNGARKLADLNDQIETFDAFLEGYLSSTDRPNILGFEVYIKTKFADSDKYAICFSTVHKSKGLEAPRVFILRPELMPFPAAKLDWQIQQEWNLLYVAITRAQHELYFVGSVPGGLVLPPTEEALAVATAAVEAAAMQEEPTTEPLVEETPKRGRGRPKGTFKGRHDVNVPFKISPDHLETLRILMKAYNEAEGTDLPGSQLLEKFMENYIPSFKDILAIVQNQNSTPGE